MENESQHNQLYDQIFKDYCAGYTDPQTHQQTLDHSSECTKKSVAEIEHFVNSSDKKFNSFAGRLRKNILMIEADTNIYAQHFDSLFIELELTPIKITTTNKTRYYINCKKQDIEHAKNILNLYGLECNRFVANDYIKIYKAGKYNKIVSSPNRTGIAKAGLYTTLATDNDPVIPFIVWTDGAIWKSLSDYWPYYKRARIPKSQVKSYIFTALRAGIIDKTYFGDNSDKFFEDYDTAQSIGSANEQKSTDNPHSADIADELIATHNIIRLDGYSDKMSLYRYCDNYYKPFEHKNELLGLIKQSYKYTTPADKSAVLENINIEESIGKERNNNLIAFNNGVIDTEADELQLLPHNPDYIVTYKIPFDFIEDLNKVKMDEIKPLINALDLWTDHDKDLEKQLYNIFGYCLTSNCRLEKFFVFTGIGSNGKSSFMNFAEYIIPKNLRGSLNPKQIADRFSTATLTNKLVNFCHDTNLKEWDIDMTDRLKVISSGETIHVDEKFIAPHDINIFAKLIFNMNRLPKSKDTGKGFRRRFMVVPFRHSFEEAEKDVNLLDKLRTPTIASYFLSRAVMTYQQELHNPDNPDHIYESQASKDAIHQWLLETNSVMRWFEQFEYDWANPTMTNEDLLENYKWYCENNKIFASYGMAEFKHILISQCNLVNDQKKLNGKNTRLLYKKTK